MGNTPSISVIDLIRQDRQAQAIKVIRATGIRDLVDSSGHSILRLALQHGHASLFKYLYQTRALMLPELKHQTILHRSVHLKHYNLAWKILKYKSLFGNLKDCQDQAGRTPLHLAVLANSSQMVALLLKYNASRIIQDQLGKSAKDLVSQLDVSQEIAQQFAVQDYLSYQKETSPLLTEKGQISFLQKALLDNRIPVIKAQDLQYLEIINRGSSCLVFKGKWRSTEVAIKQFKVEYSIAEKEMKKFVKQMKVLADIRHPNLLLLMGIVIDQPHLCLVTEYVPNQSLFYALHKNKGKRLNLQQRMKIAIQLAKGLVYLHTNQPPIVHRDLKPENCLLDQVGNVKIADFGLARPLSSFQTDDQLTTICIGTTRFMAPELFDNNEVDRIGLEVDIWGLGCVFIELFSDKRPWNHVSSAKANNIFYEIFHRNPIPIPDCIPHGVKEIIRGCCQYSPKQRLRITQILEKLEMLSI